MIYGRASAVVQVGEAVARHRARVHCAQMGPRVPPSPSGPVLIPASPERDAASRAAAAMTAALAASRLMIRADAKCTLSHGQVTQVLPVCESW